MARFYSLAELRGAIIVDSEGLIYGLLDDLRFLPDDVLLVAVVEASARDLVVDRDRLVEELRSRGVEVGGEDTLEYLVARAREEGLDIPVREAVRPMKLVKGFISIREVLWADKATLRKGEDLREVKVILLKTPREARFRGIRAQETLSIPKPEELKGKLVLSLSEGILGYAGDIVIGPGEPGLRAYKGMGVEGYINWLAFLSRLKKSGHRELYERLADYRDPLRNTRLDISLLGEVKRLLRELEAPPAVLGLLEQHVDRRPVLGSYRDIPWSKVRKIRDVIIVE